MMHVRYDCGRDREDESVRIDLESKYVRGLVFDQRKKMFKYLSTDNGKEEVEKVIAELSKLQQCDDFDEGDGSDVDNEDADAVDKDGSGFDPLPLTHESGGTGKASGKALGERLREQLKARRSESRRDMERRAVREVFKRYDEHGLGYIDR
jgi:hypothetical protein